MKYLSFDDVTVRGELGARCALLAGRLELPMYRPEDIFTVESGGWPGDWEGRTILALTCLARVSKREASYLDEIVDGLCVHMNSNGYLGRILPNGELDEQQLSGHSWLLRGLCEYYRYRGKDSTLDYIENIIKGLFLPAIGKYESYPIKPEQRVYEGGESGSVAGVVGLWHISTDTGCAYIPLDGVSDAYEVLHAARPDSERDELHMALLVHMADNFKKIPFIEISAQTHATLTGCRGLLRLYTLTENLEYLTFARSTFELYLKHGMTPWYANCNWFGRPEWTEPCAIIDSFMVASQLCYLTGEYRYAELAQLIFHNAICHAQRGNGGFGCDTCAGADGADDELRVWSYEAYWCCSMRGGEGLARVCQYAVADGDIPVILNPVGGTYRTESGEITVRTRYPDGGETVIIAERDMTVRLFTPSWITEACGICVTSVEKDFVILSLKKGENRFTLCFCDRVLTSSELYGTTATVTVHARGVLIIGRTEDGTQKTLNHSYLMKKDELKAEKIKIF